VSDYLRKSISNGNPREQALIRRWWHEEQGGRGRIVWEYFLEGRFADAMWFPDDVGVGQEEAGQATSQRFPLAGRDVVLCEAKGDLSPEVVGQALVYARFASRAGANVRQVVVLAELGSRVMLEVAEELGLTAVVRSLDERDGEAP